MAAPELDRATSVTRRAPGEYSAELDPRWTIGPVLNGGYLLVVLGRAIRDALPGKPDPLAVSAHYLAAAVPGPATVHVDVRRDGGRTATAGAELRQGDRTAVAVLATYGDLGEPDPAAVVLASPPLSLPPLGECVAAVAAEAPELTRRLDVRYHPDDAGFARGEASGRPELRAWFRLADGSDVDPLDPLALLLVVDALPPTLFGLGELGWAPTVELTVHLRARPAPGWLRVRIATRTIAGGMFEEDCEVWDSTDRLVAQSRQLALVPKGASLPRPSVDPGAP